MKPVNNNNPTSKKQPQWTTKISQPHENDILLGRGGSSIHNHANVRYRCMVKEFKKAYQTYTRLEKTQLAESLVQQWQAQDPPGRFLEKDDATGYWYIITEKAARRKTSQLLREGAPKIRRQLKDESDQQKQEQEQLKQQEQKQAKQVFVFSNDTETLTRRAEQTPEAAAKKKKLISRRPSKVGRVRSVTPSSPLFKTTTPLKQITPAEINRSGPSTAASNIQEQQQHQHTPLQDEKNPHSPPYPHPYYYHPYGQYQPWPYHHHQHLAVPPSPVSVANSQFPPSPHFFTTPITTTKTIPIGSSNEQDHQDQENEPLPLHNNTNNNYHNDRSDDSDDSEPTKLSITSAPSPESVLEFELGTFQASWECTSDILDHCGDISALVDEMDDEAEPESTFLNRPTIPIQQKQDANQPFYLPSPRLSPLPIHYHRDDFVQENQPGMMTGRTASTASNEKGDEPHHLLLDTWASFSFSSMDDAGLFPDSGDTTATSVFAGGESTIDILDDLDKEFEADMMLAQ